MARRNRRRRTRTRTPASHEPAPRRRRPGDLVLLGVGTVLLLLAIVAAPFVLKPASPPDQALSAIGLKPPARAVHGDNFGLRLGIRLDGCSNPADVTLVAGGTKDYWRRHRTALHDGRSRLRVVVPADGFRLVGARTTDYEEQLSPLARSPDDGKVAAVSSRPTSWGAREITVEMNGWGQTLAAVAIEFKAGWLSRRGLGTCYLRLPALVGLAGLSSTYQIGDEVSRQTNHHFKDAQIALHDQSSGLTFPFRADTGDAEVLDGQVAVDARDVDVDASESTPPPNSFNRQQAVWTCAAQPLHLSDAYITTPRAQINLPRSQLGVQSAQNCAGLAVVRATGAAWERDLALILVGAVLSLGISLIVEVLLGWRKAD